MHGKVDLTKGTSSEHLAYTVEVGGGDRGLVAVVEGGLDDAHDVGDLARTRRHVLHGLVPVLHLFGLLQDLPVEGLVVDV